MRSLDLIIWDISQLPIVKELLQEQSKGVLKHPSVRILSFLDVTLADFSVRAEVDIIFNRKD